VRYNTRVTLVDRRTALWSGALAIGALAAPSMPRPRLRRIVIVRLHGGADGLSLLPPFHDAAYRRARPTIALAPPGRGEHSAVDLDGTVGLHPRLAPLVPLFRERLLDVVPACGLAEVTRSHLVDREALDGRLAALDRHADHHDAAPRRSLSGMLAEVASGVVRGVARPLTVVHSSGWDHHAGQRNPEGPLASALDDLARGLASFARALGPDLRDTTLVTVSEFGRAVRENGLGGSEHGHATAVFVLGGPARRGRVVGRWPTLDATGDVQPAMPLDDVLAGV
jgi:uncharacterized protein (DUF1501 family)